MKRTYSDTMFLPSTPVELKRLGWDKLDVILVNGDAYIDSPFSGIAVIGKTLLDAGYKVGVISQPDMSCDKDILRLGSPCLFWGVSAGATDSLVANYTAMGKKRKSCDFTPGGLNNKRPDRATIIYTNLIKRFDPDKKPVVLGGIEASLRRMAHYDMLTDAVRRPILFDAKADYLIYGMGEFTAVQLANHLSAHNPVTDLKGLCYIAKQIDDDSIELPPYEETAKDKEIFFRFFKDFYDNASTLSEKPLAQKCGDRYLIQNPPYVPSPAELDHVYELTYEREAHPYDAAQGEIKAVQTIRHSITTHRGCFGECNFCAIAIHQGRCVISRSEESILREAETISKHPSFRGNFSDVGGATANMYGTECAKMKQGKPCTDKRCLYPIVCPALHNSQKAYTDLLQKLRNQKNIKNIRIASGLRTDLTIADKKNGLRFIADLAKYHTGGQIKLAPEHADNTVLEAMGKCGLAPFMKFTDLFMKESQNAGKKQFITCYFMSSHPGSTLQSMNKINELARKLGFHPEQIQTFTPTPSTWSTCMYHTEKHFKTGNKIHVPKTAKEKNSQNTAFLKKK